MIGFHHLSPQGNQDERLKIVFKVLLNYTTFISRLKLFILYEHFICMQSVMSVNVISDV